MLERKYENFNKKRWSEAVLKNQLLYPDERVISFFAKYYFDLKKNSQKNALDIGFGSGRHLKLMADYNFNAYGIDYATEAIKIAKRLFGKVPQIKELKCADLRDESIRKNFFDVIVLWGTIFLRDKKEMENDLLTINSLLKSKGKFVCNFRTKNNWFYGKGKKIDEDTFFLDKSAGTYRNIFYTFLDINQIENILKKTGFKVLSKEYMELKKDNLKKTHSWWIVYAEKK